MYGEVGSAKNKKIVAFHVHNAVLDWYLTFTAGFFAEIQIAIRSIYISIADTVMQVPLIDTSMMSNNIALWGWGINYDAIPILDFIDCMVRIGVLTPASMGSPLLPDSNGYTSWGIPLAVDCAIGLYEWMTLGVHGSTIVLLAMHRPIIFHIAPYFKADHVVRGLSVWLGYAYTGETESSIAASIMTHTYRFWDMHTVQVGLEYECIQEACIVHPRIGIFYNHVLGGINSHGTNMVGGSLSIDFIW
jgi:hypothetical protein